MFFDTPKYVIRSWLIVLIPEHKRYTMPPLFDIFAFCRSYLDTLDCAFSGGIDLGHYQRSSKPPESFNFKNKAEATKLLQQLNHVAVFHIHTAKGDLFIYFEEADKRITLRGYDEPEHFAKLCAFTESLLS